VRTAIRKHLSDFVAIVVIFILAIGVAGYILSNERLYLPSWVPLVGTDFYVVKANLATAQAVVPGQGQTVNIAGVKVGEVGSVDLKDGRALVDMKIKRKYAPIYRDASILLRPKTGLKDMFLSLDPGTKSAGKLPDGGTVPVQNTLPDVNLDEILARLDSDTRSYLRVLLNAGGEAFTDPKRAGEAPPAETGASGAEPQQSAAQDLRETFKRFEPTARDARKITLLLAERRRNIRRSIHNFQELVTELGRKDTQLAAFVDSSNANFEALAHQEANLRAALRLAPGALGQTATTLTKVDALAKQLGPALQGIRPAARALGPTLRETRPFLRETTPVIRTEIRPFARDVQPTVRDLRHAAQSLSGVTPHLTRSFKVINAAFNELAYDPPGPEQGFLFWNAWLAHVGPTLFSAQDANGLVRRVIVFMSCTTMSAINTITQDYFDHENDPTRQSYTAETALLFALQNPPLQRCTPPLKPLPPR
jgi:phospholipid/cholesterol/gamma-HCH transport system substrate-binding protein